MYDFAKNVVGDNGEVSVLLMSVKKSHGYEPTPQDIAAIAEADVFIYNSDEMETWVPAVLESIGSSDVIVVEAAENIALFEMVEMRLPRKNTMKKRDMKKARTPTASIRMSGWIRCTHKRKSMPFYPEYLRLMKPTKRVTKQMPLFLTKNC